MSPRENRCQLAAAPGESLANPSALIGRADTYPDRFVTRRSPRRLASDDRLHLAIYPNVEERKPGAREIWAAAL